MSSCSGTAETFCLHSDGFIYGLASGGSSCASKLTSNVHVFNSSNEEVTLTENKKIDSTDVVNYIMYVCSTTGCAQSIGYIKIDELYTLTTSAPTGTWDSIYTNYFTKANGSFTAVAEVQGEVTVPDWTTNTYYEKKENAFYSVSKSGATSSDSDVTCASGKSGLFDKTNGLCVGMKSDGSTAVNLAFSGSDELLLTVAASGSVFTVSSGSGILLKASANVIYHNNAPSGIYLYFFFFLYPLYSICNNNFINVFIKILFYI